jgi:hypothetical protein
MLLKAGDRVVMERAIKQRLEPRVLWNRIVYGCGEWIEGTISLLNEREVHVTFLQEQNLQILANGISAMVTVPVTYRYPRNYIGSYIIPAEWKHIQFHTGDYIIHELSLGRWEGGEVLYHHKGVGELCFKLFLHPGNNIVNSSFAGRYVLPVRWEGIDLDRENDDRDEPLATKPECTCNPVALLSGVFDETCQYHSKV